MSLKTAQLAQEVFLRPNMGPKSASQRAREPISRSRGLVRGKFPSKKSNQVIHWESQLEQQACYYFEFASKICRYKEQPETIVYEHNGKMRHYTPDFELTLADHRRCFVEIKPLGKMDVELRAKFDAISAVISGLGHRFVVITDRELNHPIRNYNLKNLRQYLLINISLDQQRHIDDWLNQTSQPTIQGLLSQTQSISLMWAFIAQQHVWLDVDLLIHADSRIFQVRQQQGENHETFKFNCRTAPDFEPCAF